MQSAADEFLNSNGVAVCCDCVSGWVGRHIYVHFLPVCFLAFALEFQYGELCPPIAMILFLPNTIMVYMII